MVYHSGHARLALTAEQRFWNRVDRGDEAECWPWTAYRNPHGYGQLCWLGARQLAHRVAHFLNAGQEVEKDAVIMHRCDNPACCNPSHLILGTQADNMADCKRKGRARNVPRQGECHHKAKLTDADVRFIRRSALNSTQLAQQLSVSLSIISRVRLGKTWRHVT